MTQKEEVNPIQAHIFATYITSRYGMAVLAFAFPMLLYFVGRIFHGIDLLPSMSAYYHADAVPKESSPGGAPMRVWFVGILFAVGSFLYLYKGFRTDENIALNVAGFSAAGVAIFPMDKVPTPGFQLSDLSMHGFFAMTLFVCLAYVSLKCAKRTLRYLPLDMKHLETSFSQAYTWIGLLMLASPLVAFVATVIFGAFNKYTFFIEAAGVWAFALYWFVKSREMALSEVDEKAAKGKIPDVPDKA